MRINTITGQGPAAIRKFILTEDGTFTIPPNLVILHSEVVVDSSGTEVLEVWAAVPTVVSDPPLENRTSFVNTSQNPKTIYTNTVVYDDELEGYNPISKEDDDEFYYD